MEISEINRILSAHFKTEIECDDFDKARWSDKGTGKNNYSPRDRQLAVFKGRLPNLDRESPIYGALKEFVAELELLPTNANLYYWSCIVGKKSWGGWASSEKVIYCLPRAT